MLTTAEQSRRAVLLASIENALEFHQQVLELRELLELERKEAAETVRVVSCDWCGGWDTSVRIVKSGDYEVCRSCAKEPPEKLRAILANKPQPCLDETKMHEWRRELNRMINESLFPSEKDSYAELEHYKAMDDRGVMRWGTNLFWKVEEIPSEMRELWTLEQLRRNVLAKSPTIVLPEEVAVLMPGDYVPPHGTYNYDSREPDNWIYQGTFYVAPLEESTKRILAAIDKRGAEMLASRAES